MTLITKQCPKCNHENEGAANFCKNCGRQFENSPLTERVIYKDDNVLISTTRYRSFNIIYAMKDITSVGVTKKEADRTIPFLIWIFAIVQMIFFDNSVFGDILLDSKYLDGVLIIIVGIIINSLLKDTFYVTITNNSGQINTLESENGEYVSSLVDSLSRAIIERG